MRNIKGTDQLRTWMNNIKSQVLNQQKNTINLIASDSIAFPEVIEAMGSAGLSDKYSEGLPGKRYYPGNVIMDKIESKANNIIGKIFNVPFVNVQPYSGSIANYAVYNAVMDPDDSFMGHNLPDGGHMKYGWKINVAANRWKSRPYNVNPKTGLIDMDQARFLAIKHKPKLIWCGASAYSRTIPFEQFSNIAKETGAYLAADISHIAQLVVGKVHPSPHKYVDIITTATHKMRGPNAAIIMATEKGLKRDPKLGEKLNFAVFPKLQGGPHMDSIFGIAVMAHKLEEEGFQEYAQQIVKNSKCLAMYLQYMDMKIVSNGTDNHLMLLDFSAYGHGRGIYIQLALESVGILCDKTTIPGEQGSPIYPSAVRIGTQVLTIKGALEEDMIVLAEILYKVISKTMTIVNDDIYMAQNLCTIQPLSRSHILNRFKEKLMDDNLFIYEKLQVQEFLDQLPDDY